MIPSVASIINKLLGENRVIVSDVAGTTRDAVDTAVKWNGKEYVFIDTAGLRRKNKIKEEIENERSSIVKLGVRVNPLTVDESINFEKGKSITTNADRTLKRSMRRNLHRYKLRREALIEVLKECKFITTFFINHYQYTRKLFQRNFLC